MGGNIVLTTILTYFIFLKPFKNVYIKLYGAFFSTVIVANIFKLISISFDGEFSIAYTLLNIMLYSLCANRGTRWVNTK